MPRAFLIQNLVKADPEADPETETPHPERKHHQDSNNNAATKVVTSVMADRDVITPPRLTRFDEPWPERTDRCHVTDLEADDSDSDELIDITSTEEESPEMRHSNKLAVTKHSRLSTLSGSGGMSPEIRYRPWMSDSKPSKRTERCRSRSPYYRPSSRTPSDVTGRQTPSQATEKKRNAGIYDARAEIQGRLIIDVKS